MSIKPQRNYALTEAERDAFEDDTLADAELLARKLCGDAPYCREEVKGWHIAAVIRSLISIIGRILAGKTAANARELEAENKELRRLYDLCRREAARWQLHMPEPELPWRERGA